MLSDLALYPGGADLAGARWQDRLYWDELNNLQPMIQESRLERNITVTVEYQDITGSSCSREWEIDPVLYEGIRPVGYKDMSELLDTVDKIPEDRDSEAKKLNAPGM